MRTTIKEYIEDEIKEQQQDIDKANSKLEKDYVYNFEWDYPGMLYQSHYLKRIYETLLTFLNNEPERVEEWLEFNIAETIRKFKRGEFILHSSSQFSNLAHTLKLNADAEALKKFEWWLKFIKEDTPIK